MNSIKILIKNNEKNIPCIYNEDSKRWVILNGSIGKKVLETLKKKYNYTNEDIFNLGTETKPEIENLQKDFNKLTIEENNESNINANTNTNESMTTNESNDSITTNYITNYLNELVSKGSLTTYNYEGQLAYKFV